MSSSKTIVLTAVLALGLTACKNEPQTAHANVAPAVTVQAVTAERSQWPVVSEAVGTVRARTTATLASKVMGYVREVRVHAGDRVASGQLLLSLDSRDLDVSLRQADAARQEARDSEVEVNNAILAAKANLDLVDVTFRRMKDLFDKQSISNQEYDEAASRLKTAQANYEMALSKKTQIGSRIRQAEEGLQAAQLVRSYAEIRAPFAGIVTERRAEPGILATPGLPLITVEQGSAYRLEVNVEESLAPRLRLGETTRITLEALDRSVDAAVSEIVPAVDPASRAFIVKIDLPAIADLRSGQYGRARFTTGSRETVSIPVETVRRNGQIESVLVADNGVARLRMVTTGEAVGGRLEILTGLKAGESVVRGGSDLQDGARLEVR